MDGYIDIASEDELLAYWTKTPNLPQHGYTKGAPQSGPCVKCIQYRESHTPGVNEIYGRPGDGASKGLFDGVFFDKTIAADLTEGKTPKIIPTRLLSFLIYQNDYCETHVRHVAEVMTPGIVVMGAVMHEGAPTMFSFLIDGTHRAVAAQRASRDFMAYILTAEETMICAEKTRKQMSEDIYLLVDPSPRLTGAQKRERKMRRALEMSL